MAARAERTDRNAIDGGAGPALARRPQPQPSEILHAPPARSSGSTDRQAYQYLFILSGALFVIASAIGMVAAIVLAAPDSLSAFAPFEILRPLHTFCALAAVILGLQALIALLAEGNVSKIRRRLQLAALLAFCVGGGVSVLTGQGTGREYFTWPVFWTALLALSLLMSLLTILEAWTRLVRRSPEGAWLIALGAAFMLLGLAESYVWRLPFIGADFVRDLTIQWHGIDTFFAGLTTALFGCGAFMLSDKPKPLRGAMLFGLAAFSMLFAFGHHHYASPQPHFLKVLAFLASMVAIVSFWRNFIAYRRLPVHSVSARYAAPLWRTALLWTTVSIASGILFAIPQLNVIAHGTYLIVVHAMGSMIGAYFVIIVAGGLTLSAKPQCVRPSRIRLGLRLLNFSLAGLWLVLGATGLAEGMIRANGDHFDYQETRDFFLTGFPIIGVILCAGVTVLCWEMLRANLPAGAGPAQP